MSKASRWFFVFVAVVAFNSCRQSTAPVETANIHGSVELAQGIFLSTPPFSGVTVALEGTGYSAMTDDSGNFTLHNIPTGTYNVRFSKPGYGDVRWVSTTVTGGGNTDVYWNLPQYYETYLNPTVLYRISKIVTVLDGLRFLDSTVSLPYANTQGPMFMASGSVVPDLTRPQYEGAMALYVSHTSDVSAQPGHYTTFYYGSNAAGGGGALSSAVTHPIDTTAGRFHFLIMQYELKYFGFKSGDSIYVAAYGAPSYSVAPGGDYYDPILQQYVLTSVNQTPSPVIGTVVP